MLTHFWSRRIQRNSSCVSKFRSAAGLASARRAISGHGSAACSLTRSAAMVEPDAFTQLLSYVERETETLKRLRCQTLKECLLTGKANSKREGNAERFKDYKMYLALQNKMSAEQRDMLAEWERGNCVQDAVGLRPAFQKFCSIAEQHVDAMRALRKPCCLLCKCRSR